MTQEQKDLLLKDLCVRLPYGVKVLYENEIFDVEYVCPMYEEIKLDIPETWTIGIDEVKPYLFPLSSMSEKQKEEFNTQSLKLQLQVIDEEIMYEKATEFEVDFYNKHHLDWRGLIPLGLAIDATNLNIY